MSVLLFTTLFAFWLSVVCYWNGARVVWNWCCYYFRCCHYNDIWILSHFGFLAFWYGVAFNHWCPLYEIHDDVFKWKYFPRYWPFVRGIRRSPVNSPHEGQWRGALMFSLICVRTNGWVKIETLVIWDAIVLIMAPFWCPVSIKYSPLYQHSGKKCTTKPYVTVFHLHSREALSSQETEPTNINGNQRVDDLLTSRGHHGHGQLV